MHSMHLLLSLFVGGWLAAMPARADVCTAGDNGERLEHRYSIDQCRIADQVLQQRTAAVTQGFGAYEDAASFDAWPMKAHEQLQRALSDINADRQRAQTAGDSKLANRFGELAERVNVAAAKLASLRDLNELGAATAPVQFKELQVDTWQVRAEPRELPGELAANYLEQERCLDADVSDARCERLYANAVQLADHAFIVARIVSRLQLPLRRQFRDEAERRTAAWHAYLYDAQFQYWWELAFNRYLESRCPHGLNAPVARWISKSCERAATDAAGNEIGFRPAPDYKASLLHPDIGVMYLDDEPKGDRFKPALLLQVLGYEWWDWDGAAIQKRRGAALVLTASDNARVSAVGYGVQFRWEGYALALTNHAGTLALTLNLDLVGRIATTNPKWAERVKVPLEAR